ncbi:MAG TPA: lactate utilization protein [Vicinamibacterales bacterium]|nr:lactate utilization protein [Vicinamibacterales bacterium]
MTAREQILRRVAGNLRRGWGAGAAHAHRTPPKATVEAMPPLSVRERFTAELEALGGRVHAADSPEAAIDAMVGICAARQAPCVLAWYEEHVGLPGLRRALFDRRVGYDTGFIPDGEPARSDRLQSLERIRIGVTGAAAGIAESGTIVVVSGPGRPRLASLLPPVHVAVLRADRLYATLPDVLAAQPDLVEQGSNLVLITGPSRTADIEMTLTRGVHGPGEVHVILVS